MSQVNQLQWCVVIKFVSKTKGLLKQTSQLKCSLIKVKKKEKKESHSARSSEFDLQSLLMLRLWLPAPRKIIQTKFDSS